MSHSQLIEYAAEAVGMKVREIRQVEPAGEDYDADAIVVTTHDGNRLLVDGDGNVHALTGPAAVAVPAPVIEHATPQHQIAEHELVRGTTTTATRGAEPGQPSAGVLTPVPPAVQEEETEPPAGGPVVTPPAGSGPVEPVEPVVAGPVDPDAVPTGNAQGVIEWMGTDPARAQRAKEAEQLREKPRSTVMTRAEQVIDGDDASSQ